MDWDDLDVPVLSEESEPVELLLDEFFGRGALGPGFSFGGFLFGPFWDPFLPSGFLMIPGGGPGTPGGPGGGLTGGGGGPGGAGPGAASGNTIL